MKALKNTKQKQKKNTAHPAIRKQFRANTRKPKEVCLTYGLWPVSHQPGHGHCWCSRRHFQECFWALLKGHLLLLQWIPKLFLYNIRNFRLYVCFLALKFGWQGYSGILGVLVCSQPPSGVRRSIHTDSFQMGGPGLEFQHKRKVEKMQIPTCVQRSQILLDRAYFSWGNWVIIHESKSCALISWDHIRRCVHLTSRPGTLDKTHFFLTLLYYNCLILSILA